MTNNNDHPAPSSHGDRSRTTKRARRLGPIDLTPSVIVVMLLGVFLAVLLAHRVYAADAWGNGATAGVTGLAFATAIAIYIEQTRTSRETHEALLRQLDRMPRDAAEAFAALDVDENVLDGDQKVDGGDGDAEPLSNEAQKAVEEFERHATMTSKGLRYAPANAVPLELLAQILHQSDDQLTTDLRWVVGNVAGVARKPGKGNHAWFIAIRDLKGSLRIWKVTKGGAGQAGVVHVKEHTEGQSA